MDELKKYLLNLGVSKVGYADVKGLASEFVDLPNGISLVLKIPKETIQLVIDEDYEDYFWYHDKGYGFYYSGEPERSYHTGQHYRTDM